MADAFTGREQYMVVFGKVVNAANIEACTIGAIGRVICSVEQLTAQGQFVRNLAL
jgi:hypothetical protein